MKIQGSRVLLTGATGGIGHAIGRELAGRGAALVITGRRQELLDPLASELSARALAIDLSDRAEIERLVAEAGEVDVLVANAALPASGQLASFTTAEIDRALDVNLRAPVILSHALVPAMVARGSGHLVFISSLAGKTAAPGASLYQATKFGLRGFAAGLRMDLQASGVGVSAVFPGFISDAGMFADSGASLPPGVGTRTPEHVARAVVRAIEQDRGEIDVAPAPVRAGALLSGLAPELAARITRRMGAERISAEIGAGQADKR